MFVTAALVCLCIFFLFFTREKSRWENLPPGPKGLPFVGSLLNLLFEEPTHYYTKLYEKYGPIISAEFGSRRVLILSSSKWVKQAFLTQGTMFSGRPDGIALSYITSGKGIVMSQAEVNFHARRTLMSTFKHFGYGQNKIENIIDVEVDSLLKIFKNNERKKYNPRYDLAVSALNVTWNMLSGERFQREDTNLKWNIKTIPLAFELVKQGGFLNFTFIIQLLSTFLQPKSLIVGLSVITRFQLFKNTISKHRKQMESLSRDQDFVYNFLEEQKRHKSSKTMQISFSDSQLSWILNDVFIASLETTSNSLQWALIVLADRSDIQDCIIKEIEREIGKDRKPSLSHRKSMPYTEAFISEVLRFYPALPLLMHAASNDTKLGDYFIPKGTWVIVNLWNCLKNKEDWGDAENFRPSRFLNEEGNYTKHPDHIPFFVGRRNCIGEPLGLAEMFLFLTNIVQNYEVQKYDESKPWNTNVKFTLSVTPLEVNFKFIPRCK